MASRLDRLLLLLDTGSSQTTRRAAAEQLGDVQKLHPHDLQNLLFKVLVYLRNNSWDTRIAAGYAVEAIVKQVPLWEPEKLQGKDGESATRGQNESRLEGRMGFSSFDITRVLEQGTTLLGSAGDEYDMEPDSDLMHLSHSERSARQRKLLQKRLGLEGPAGLGFDKDLFEDDDFMPQMEVPTAKTTTSVADFVSMELSGGKGLSAREKNRARRLARKAAKNRIKETHASSSNSVPENTNEFDSNPVKKPRTSNVLVPQSSHSDRILIDAVADVTATFEEAVEWPFESFCDELCNDLFNAKWTIRHGAAIGLREIIRIHGHGAGKTLEMPADQMGMCNSQWLEDLALRLLCVFALDRFGDYLSDEVVAPVREMCAQTLGVVVKYMGKVHVQGVLNVLLTLQAQQQWQVRYGGLLGAKYLLAVRQDMAEGMLPLLLNSVKQGLEDPIDDVRAVAATSLLPVTDKLISLLPHELPSLLSLLWDTLAELDDLTSSTNGIMSLLASLYSCPSVAQLTAAQTTGPYSLAHLVPRLWRFLSHTIVSVRQATVRTLRCLLSCLSDKVDGVASWMSLILPDMLRHVYQRLVLEPKEDLKQSVLEIWISLVQSVDAESLDKTIFSCLGTWLSLAVYPANVTIDASLLTSVNRTSELADRTVTKSHSESQAGDTELRLSGVSATEDNEDAVVATRLSCAKALGELAFWLSQLEQSSSQQQFTEFLSSMLASNSSTQRLMTALIVTEWATKQKPPRVPEELVQLFVSSLEQSPMYDEVMMLFGKMQTDCQNLMTAFLERGVNLFSQFPSEDFSIDQASVLVTSVYSSSIQRIGVGEIQSIQQNKARLSTTLNKLQTMLQSHHVRVQASLAAAAVALGCLPVKLNPVIRPLMESIKKEENETMQWRTASYLPQLLGLSRDRNPCPNDKIVKNLCTLLCADANMTPRVPDPVLMAKAAPSPAGTPTTPLTPEAEMIGSHFQRAKSPLAGMCRTLRGNSIEAEQLILCGKFAGIVTLVKRQQAALMTATSHGRRGMIHTSRKQQPQRLTVTIDPVLCEDDFAQQMLVAQCRGAKASLLEIAKFFGSQLPTAQPKLWDSIVSAVQTSIHLNTLGYGSVAEDESTVQDLVNSLQVLEVISPGIDNSLRPQILDLMPKLCTFLRHRYCAVRHMSSRCIAAMTSLSVVTAMEAVIINALPLLDDADCVAARQGAMETVAILVDELGMEILPYAVLLVVPLLGRMSDQEDDVRLLATQSFASLVKLMPLEAGIADPPGMAIHLAERRVVERRFLEQLLDPKKLDSYVISVPIKTDLRKYQKDGVNWLGFLNKYKLHGILCDDMGLGKTLQTICIMAGDYQDKLKQCKEGGEKTPLPSLVICPPTLTGHWCYEVEKFCCPEHLSALHYSGGPAERQRLWKMLPMHNLVVASYDIVRNDIDYFRGTNWNYLVLDEGHIIRNGRTKLSKAIKSLKADHRLILTGTPIQNNVLELWSLFDFLMPGFLGTEKEFTARYSRPILQSRDAKSSSKEQEAGVLAMESLHRQVLPFMLRRLKEDVLQDLPPKIIQDYYCDLSSLQVWLYEDFAKSTAKKTVEKMVTESAEEKVEEATVAVQSSTHIFQALQYLRKLCNHPMLVVNEKHPRFEAVKERLNDQKTLLGDTRHAGKLIALKQLLLDCGIGVLSDTSTSTDPMTSNPVVGQHRALVFCQLKSMLDIIEHNMLKKELTSVSYLRLDGSIPAGSRYDIVRRFNSDPSIDVLLLTTHVGGLGLNLTGADTVIFVEHDWNPMRDLQAMDRAHRIGQKKVVNVYRLITRGTLEEKIMGLQKFKLSIANTVVTQDNSSLQSMGTNELLELFDVGQKSDKKEKEPSLGKQSIKSVLESMEALWDEKQYEAEHDLTTFMESLK